MNGQQLGGLEMINPRPHKRLDVWQKSMDLVTKIYGVTERFPKSEEFGLKNQLRRAAVSVPSNIAEGLTRKGQKDRLHFLNVSQASLSEIDTQMEIALRLTYVSDDQYESVENELVHVQKLLSGLTRSLS